MRYIRGLDENYNEILYSKNLKKTYKMKYTTVRGSKNIRLSLGIAALGFVIGFVAGGYVLAGLGIFNGVIGAILGFLFKYYISGSKKPGVEEIE